MRSTSRWAGIVGAVLAVASTVPASAQTDQGVEAYEEALRRIRSLEEAERSALDAGRYLRIEGGPVSLAEVLRDPDNIELNYRYAQTQVADGNLRSAAATLERILLLEPNLPRIRLFYAFVLLRLDNALEARAQLASIDRAALEAEDRIQAEELESRIRQRTRRTRFHAVLTAGMSYQTNANFAPESEQVDVIVDLLGIRIPLVDVPTAGPEDDLSYIAGARVGFVHDLGVQARDEVFGSVGFLYDNQVEIDATDSTDYGANLGTTVHTGAGDLTAQLITRHYSLDDDSFLTDYALDIAWQRRYLGERLLAFARARAAFEDYDNADGNTPERTGARYELELAGLYRLSRTQRLGLSLELDDKQAREEWREFDGVTVSLHHTWLLKRSVFVRNLVAYANEVYDQANPRVSARRRHDHELAYRLTLSAPLGALVPGMPRALRDIRLIGSAQYEHTRSNVQNFERDNVTGELLFRKRLEF